MVSRIIIGFIGASAGFLLTWKSEWIYENFGQSDFAEHYLRLFGGTRLFIKLFGVLVIIISLMHMTGLLGDTVYWLVSPLFRGFAGTPGLESTN